MSLYVQHRPEEATFFEGYIGGYFVFGMGVFLLKQGDFWTMALTDTEIKKAKTKGKAYGMRDGSGLYLWITPSGGRL